MRTIIHHTTKYDGSIHYRFSAEVVYETDDTLAIYSPISAPMDSYRGRLMSKWHTLLVFYANKYHNTVVAWCEDWTPRMHYVNIATPAEWTRRMLSAIDLDLDLILSPDEGKIILDDEDEFREHIDSFGYPRELICRCREEAERVEAAMRAGTGIFNADVFGWRPGDVVDSELVRAP